MHVNYALATFSDYAYRTAVTLYLFAMILFLAEFARARSAPDMTPARVNARVDAAAATAGSEQPPAANVATVTELPPSRDLGDRLGRVAVGQTILAAAVHALSIVLRGLATQRWPWGNMYEFISAICLAGVASWLIALRRTPTIRPTGAFVLLPVEALLFLGGTVLYVDASPVMPALRSYWLSIHVSTVSVSSGLFLVAGVASALFLMGKHSSRVAGGRLPSTASLDRVAYRLTAFSFLLYTFALITGAMWAEGAWGRYWGWDPKETVAFVVWVLYACYLHARGTAGWRNGQAAWINVLGLIAVLFNLFFINLVTTGFHSYAGLN